MENLPNILFYGYGNPGRQDDGLAAEIIQKVEKWAENHPSENVTWDTNYQLQVEDITLMHDKDLVIFVDASMEDKVRDFAFTSVMADSEATFSMHAVAPAYLLDLCQKIYGSHPPAFLLHIRGYGWDLDGNITPKAQKNLEKAWQALKYVLLDPDVLFKHELPLQK